MASLVVGLGNPGQRYSRTRHNIGFMVLDRLAAIKGLSWKDGGTYQVCCFNDLWLIKPQTYMNLSGQAVKKAKLKYNAQEVLVVVDDVHLPLASIRLREAGSHGGHNGVASVISCLGGADFARLRLGVSEPSGNMADYVLSRFNMHELHTLESALELAAELVLIWAEQGFMAAAAHYSKVKKSYSEEITLRINRPKEDR